MRAITPQVQPYPMSAPPQVEILPVCAYDTALWPRPCPEIAPHVHGVVFEQGDRLYVPFLVSLRPGCGFVRRYLDSLPADKTVIFPEVMSAILDAALQRRGFQPVLGYAPVFGDRTHCLIRDAQSIRHTETSKGAAQ